MSDENGLSAAKSAKQKIRERFAGCAELRGVGLTRRGDAYVVKLNLASRPDDLLIPDDIDGIPVIVDIVGKIKAR